MKKIFVEADTIPEGWETSVIRCWNEGAIIKTEYDKPEDPPSRDCTLMLDIKNPMKEPRIHRAFPGGLEDLEMYRQEVVEGIHDHWIKPEEGKWSYSYSCRIFKYNTPGASELTVPMYNQYINNGIINQANYVIDKLIESPHTRRAQIIIWNPYLDPPNQHCPCLQRLFFRIFDNKLHMNIHIRSNDAFKAGFMNMWAFVDIQRFIAEEVSKRIGKKIEVGSYCHIADSFHIYGSYFKEFEGFLKLTANRKWEERTFRSDDPVVVECFKEAREKIAKEIKIQ